MLHIVDSFIQEISFCTAFSFTESKCHFERTSEEVRQLIDAGKVLYEAHAKFPGGIDDSYDNLILADDYIISFVQEAITRYENIHRVPNSRLEDILQWRADYQDVAKWLIKEREEDTAFYTSNRNIVDQYLETCDISGDQMYTLMGL